jgi:hypothetical protein
LPQRLRNRHRIDMHGGTVCPNSARRRCIQPAR